MEFKISVGFMYDIHFMIGANLLSKKTAHV